MWRLLVAAAIVAISMPTIRADYSMGSYAFSKQYVVTISDKALEKSPSWNDDADDPPLSAKRAIKLATGMKDSLVKDSKDFKWKLRSAALEPTDRGKWYWLITFEAEFQGVISTGSPSQLRLVVLMDGKVIKPKVNHYP